MLSAILLQAEGALNDSIAKTAAKIAALPDSLSQMTPGKLQHDLKTFHWDTLVQNVTNQCVNLAFRILAAVVVFYLGKFIIGKLHHIVRAILLHRDVDKSLSSFLLSFMKITLLFVLVISVIGILGIETSSFIAIFASAGVAVGMALSGTLQNFAGGVLILLIKPYKVGDYIVFGEYKGYVKEIQIFHTILTTYSNEKIIIPNGGLSTGTINNFSAEKYHRLEWHVSIAYGDDVKRARQVVLDILHADRRILKDFLPDEIAAIETVQPKTETDSEKNTSFWKSIFNHHKVKQKVDDIKQLGQQQLAAKIHKKDCTPYVAVDSLGDSAVLLVVRAWTTTENYWSVLYDTYECIYERLPQEGLHFPYPQMDVYLKKN